MMNHIGYRGTAAAMTDLLGGQIAAFMGTVSDVNARHKAGKVVARIHRRDDGQWGPLIKASGFKPGS
jgi:tripartite-type tricarboxylate transporter receptor subunit TctC